MKTIKIIDLLTKRANGEGGLRKFKYHNIIWELNILDYSYYNESGIEFEEWLDDDLMNCLNDEIEIPDEEDGFEDINELENYKIDDDTIKGLIKSINTLNDDFTNSINQLIKNQKKIIERLKELEK